MKKKDFIIKTSNSSGHKTIEIIKNIDDVDNLIFQWKPRKKKKKQEKLDPNNLIEAEMVKKRRKALLDSVKALNRK